jgi:hypothetical protein
VKLLDIIDRSNAKFTIFCNSKAVDNKPQVNERWIYFLEVIFFSFKEQKTTFS